MAKSKLIALSSFRMKGEHVEKGTILDLDADVKKDADTIAELARAGRISLATPDLEKQIKAEIKAEEAERELHKRRLLPKND